MSEVAFAETWRKVAASRSWAALDSVTQKKLRALAEQPENIDASLVHPLPKGTSCGMCFRHSEDHTQAQWAECFKAFLARIPEKLEVKVVAPKKEADVIRWRAQGYTEQEIALAQQSGFHPWYYAQQRIKHERAAAGAATKTEKPMNPYAVSEPAPHKPTGPTWFRADEEK